MAINISRSPNYPSMSLGDAVDAIREVYAREKRAKFPRSSLATHLGYTSLNGRALSKIGALRAYKLIEGREDALTVSAIARALIDAPKESEDYIHALHEAFNSPPLFSRILAEHGDETPSPQTLRWWLSQQGYVGDAADKALKVYLASVELVNSLEAAYNPDVAETAAPAPSVHPDMLDVTKGLARSPIAEGKSATQGGGQSGELAMSVHERVLQSGMLSKTASYRVIVSGPVGVSEIERLLKKLEMDKEILADAGPEPDRSEGLAQAPAGSGL